MQFQKILIAVEDSNHSMEAARAGIQLAQKVNAEIAVMCAIDIGVTITGPEMVPPPIEIINLQRDEAHSVIEKVKALYSGASPVTEFVPEGDPREEIIAVAEQWGAQVIILGTHGRTGFTHLLMGSTAEYVVRHSKVPVLVVPLKKDEGINSPG
ncbi:MAG: universal stress protein [Bacteroidota bacterium]